MTSKSLRQSGKLFGYFIGMIAAAAYGFNPAFALPLMNGGMDVISVLLFRYALAVPAIYLLLRLRGRTVAIGMRKISASLGVGVLMVLSSITLFESYNHLSVGIASSLLFIYPLLVALIMVVCYHEKMTVLTAVCLIGALAGVAMLCVTEPGTLFSITGVIIVFASSLSYALYIVYVNREPLRSVPTLALTFWVLVAGTFVTGVFVISRGHVAVPEYGWGWFNLVMLALVPTLLSLVCTNVAIERIGPTPTAVLGVFEPVTAVLLGMLLFHERLSALQWIGVAVIFVAVSLVVMRDDLSRSLVAIRKNVPFVTSAKRQ